MDVRRVVTGHDSNGRAVFVSDELVEPTPVPLVPGYEIYRVWGADEAPTFPDDGSMPAPGTLFPELGETQDFIVLVVLADLAVGVAEHPGLGVLGQEGQQAFLAAAALGNIVFFQQGVVAVGGEFFDGGGGGFPGPAGSGRSCRRR